MTVLNKFSVISGSLLVSVFSFTHASAQESEIGQLDFIIGVSDNTLQNAGANLNASYQDRVFGVNYEFYESDQSSASVIVLTGNVDADYAEITKTLSLNSTTVAVDADLWNNDWTFRMVLSHAINTVKTDRTVTDPFGPGSETYLGDYDANETAAYVEAAYTFGNNSVQVSPYVSWFRNSYYQAGYTETNPTGGGGGNVEPKHYLDQSRPSIGVLFTQQMPLRDWQMLEFYQKIQYSKELKNVTVNGTLNRTLPVAGHSFLLWTEGLAVNNVPDPNSISYEFGATYGAWQNSEITFVYSGLTNQDLQMNLLEISFGTFF